MHKGRDLWIGGPPFSIINEFMALKTPRNPFSIVFLYPFHSSSFPFVGSPKKAGGTFLFEMDNGFQKADKIQGIPVTKNYLPVKVKKPVYFLR